METSRRITNLTMIVDKIGYESREGEGEALCTRKFSTPFVSDLRHSPEIRWDGMNITEIVWKWLDSVEDIADPDITPDQNSRIPNWEVLHRSVVVQNMCLKDLIMGQNKTGTEINNRQEQFCNAMYWFNVEKEDAFTTQFYMHAAETPRKDRSIHEQSIIRVYWNMGLTLDPLLGPFQSWDHARSIKKYLTSRVDSLPHSINVR